AGIRRLLQGNRAARDPRGDGRVASARCRRGGRDVRARIHLRARPLADHLLRRRDAMRARLLTVALLALVFPSNAFARGEFDPTKEFEQHEWVPIHLGPLNLSITKAVVYLMLGTVLTIAFGIFFMRTRLGAKPGWRETVGAQIYAAAQVQLPEQG